jgi:hypothetical protein
MVSRMNQMIDHNIQEYPGDGRTLEEFFVSIRRTLKRRKFRPTFMSLPLSVAVSCQVYTRAMVLYMQEVTEMQHFFSVIRTCLIL